MTSWLTRLLGLEPIEAAAEALASMFERHAPGDKWQNAKLVETVLRDMAAYAKGEKRKNGWGGMKLAILGNKVLWKLVERGYPKDFAKKLSTELSIFLAQDSASAKASAPK